MDLRDKITAAVFQAIDDLNLQLPAESRVQKSLDAVLYGRDGGLDSLGLMSLIVSVEQCVEREFDILINLADENVVMRDGNPLHTVGSLTDYIAELLEKTSRA